MDSGFSSKGGETLKDEFEPGKTTLDAKDYGHWIKLLNVDNPPFDFNAKKYKSVQETHSSVSQFERQWVDPRTYRRWEDEGTWYGFCYHSAAILARPWYFIFSPSATYYFDTTALLLYFRMTLFRFSKELSKAVPDQDNWNEKLIREKLQFLRLKFSTFAMSYRFLMLSNQQQSIEMNKMIKVY